MRTTSTEPGHVRVGPWALLVIYLAAGASGFTGMARTFWARERLGLSPAAPTGLVLMLDAIALLGPWLRFIEHAPKAPAPGGWQP